MPDPSDFVLDDPENPFDLERYIDAWILYNLEHPAQNTVHTIWYKHPAPLVKI